ncbi:hypothetical protein BDY21DRAFT_96904 [Lineolata rhizophorae]|uniref:Uncharacterized protein n=1 Tax=Lineolata rhizophorae TaxID=578093 RepID=A0A6A6NU01_9PEZI|nr:hypothetical protein BDY21DRAFT_96904 [Lineolata rhizophorae]
MFENTGRASKAQERNRALPKNSEKAVRRPAKQRIKGAEEGKEGQAGGDDGHLRGRREGSPKASHLSHQSPHHSRPARPLGPLFGLPHESRKGTSRRPCAQQESLTTDGIPGSAATMRVCGVCDTPSWRRAETPASQAATLGGLDAIWGKVQARGPGSPFSRRIHETPSPLPGSRLGL